MARIIGASRRSRARSKLRRSPRLPATMACSSSKMMRRRSAKRCAASGEASSSATCSGVVSNMLGGSTRWRLRLKVEVSPVRVSMRRPSLRSAAGDAQVALDVDGQRLQGRDVERVQAGAVARPLGEVDEARQEAGQRLAGACRGDEQRVLVGRGGGQQVELVLPGRPTARGKPRVEARRQQGAGRWLRGAAGARGHEPICRRSRTLAERDRRCSLMS